MSKYSPQEFKHITLLVRIWSHQIYTNIDIYSKSLTVLCLIIGDGKQNKDLHCLGVG